MGVLASRLFGNYPPFVGSQSNQTVRCSLYLRWSSLLWLCKQKPPVRLREHEEYTDRTLQSDVNMFEAYVNAQFARNLLTGERPVCAVDVGFGYVPTRSKNGDQNGGAHQKGESHGAKSRKLL